jgi:hypothetical protein
MTSYGDYFEQNRTKYLYHTLCTCIMQNGEPFEKFVSGVGSLDNF